MTPIALALAFLGLLALACKILSHKKVEKSISGKSNHNGLDIERFNDKFVAGNKALANGNTEGLKDGISIFIESLDNAGEFLLPMRIAIQELHCALSHHDRADTKGPWNRDLSGYGILSWKKDLYDRDEALGRAWPYIDAINLELTARGYGWKY